MLKTVQKQLHETEDSLLQRTMDTVQIITSHSKAKDAFTLIPDKHMHNMTNDKM